MLSTHLRKQSLITGKRYMSTTSDYQFLQRSKLPTFYFQRSLPRLPIPLLENSCNRFLAAVEPILEPKEFSEAQQRIAEFRNGVGMELHTMLKEQDSKNKHTSYISEPWFDMYLRDRAPLPLNYNPLIVLQHEKKPEQQSQIIRATNIVISSLRFWRSLRAELLEPEVYHMNPKKSDTPEFRKWMRLAPTAFATYVAYAFKAFPLDMSQYQRLFGVSRIPAKEKDFLVENPDSKHILVLRSGNIYTIDVLNEAGHILPPHVIYSRLAALIELDKTRTSASNLGVLTSLERNAWANLREHLVSINQENRLKLEKEVDSALFCISLDGENDPIYNEKAPTEILKNLLAGVGSNRWFDKSVSVLIANDGTAAINFEHSWGDGVAVLRYLNEIYKETTENPFIKAKDTPAVDAGTQSGVRAIDFHLDDHLRQTIKDSMQKNESIMKTLNMDMLRYSHINKKICKQEGISPDSIMQLSFQLAYRQAFNDYVGTYESCSTAAFRHGRTETMRPCTRATKEFCESILKTTGVTLSSNELRSMIKQCSTVHGQLTKEAAMGQGFDRHLFALKNIANQQNMQIPELYKTRAYEKLNRSIISTSTLSSSAIMAGSFGPVVPDGLGVGYSIQDNECGAIVTSYKNGADGKKFIDSLEMAFNKIRKVLME